jgi:regulatory protein
VGRTIALRQLEVRDRSRQELSQVLRRRGVPDDAATEVLDSLVRVELIDDARFARLWVEQRRESRGLARRALAQELARKGVAVADSGAVLGDLDDSDEQELADRVARRRARALAGLPPEVALRRLAGHLERKGYSAGTSMRAATAALAIDADGIETASETGAG